MSDNNDIAINAILEGESVVIKNIGNKVKVSQMELMILCNLARLACLMIFSELDGKIGEEAKEETELFIAQIKKQFANETCEDGLHRFIQSCTAILGQDRLGKYIIDY